MFQGSEKCLVAMELTTPYHQQILKEYDARHDTTQHKHEQEEGL
jgi:hypothetical protein